MASFELKILIIFSVTTNVYLSLLKRFYPDLTADFGKYFVSVWLQNNCFDILGVHQNWLECWKIHKKCCYVKLP